MDSDTSDLESITSENSDIEDEPTFVEENNSTIHSNIIPNTSSLQTTVELMMIVIMKIHFLKLII